MVVALVHGVAGDPTRAALLPRSPDHHPRPSFGRDPGHLVTETGDVGFEFVEHGDGVELVVAETSGPQVVEHRLDDGAILGPSPVQPDRAERVDIAEVADVFEDRPAHLGAAAEARSVDRGANPAGRGGHGVDGGQRGVDPDLCVRQVAWLAAVILGGPDGERALLQRHIDRVYGQPDALASLQALVTEGDT